APPHSLPFSLHDALPIFWGYGYPDLYAGIFGLYGYDDLMGYAGYLPGYAGRRGGNLDTYAYAPSNGRTNLAQMCGDDSRVIAGQIGRAHVLTPVTSLSRM